MSETQLNFEPLHDYVLIERAKSKDKTEGGILLPKSAEDKPTKGTVVAVGKGKTLDNGQVMPLTVKKGDVVIFSRYGGQEYQQGKILLRESEIFGIEKN